jgi:hypothetical protein
VALVECVECGSEVSNTVKRCVHCGHVIRGTYSNIGGWLILIIIQYIFQIFFQISNINNILMLYTNGSMAEFSNPSSDYYDYSLFSIINFELICSILIIIFIIVLLIKMFGKKKIYPKLGIIYLIAVNIYFLIDVVWVNSISGVTLDIIFNFIGSVVSAIIWILYFIKSERVKQVFIK